MWLHALECWKHINFQKFGPIFVRSRIRPSRFEQLLSTHPSQAFPKILQNFVWTVLRHIRIFVKFLSAQGSGIWREFPRSLAWWWFHDSSQLPSVTAQGKTIDWHVHRAGTAWHQFGNWNFTHCESPAITLLRKFESLPCACVNLGWPIVLPSAVTWLSG